MLPIIFSLSPKTFIQAKQRLYSMSLVFLFLPLLSLFTPMGVDMPWTFVLAFSGGVFLLLLLYIIFFSPKLLKSQFGTLRIILTEVDLIRKNRGVEEHFPYGEIKHLLIQQSRSGEVLGLKIKLSQKSILIGSLENMEQLAQLLQMQLPPSVTAKKRTTWLNMQNPITFLLFVLGCASIGLLFVQMPFSSIQNFQILFLLFSPLIFIFMRPISRSVGQHYRKKEKFLGYSMLVAAIFLGGTLLWTRDFDVLEFAPCGLIGRFIQQSGCIRSFDGGDKAVFLADNQTIATDMFNTIVLVPLSGRINYWTPNLPHDDNIRQFWVTENGRILITSTYNDDLFLWDTETQQLLESKKVGRLGYYNAILSPDGQTFFATDFSSNGPAIGVWQTQPLQKIDSIPGTFPFAYNHNNHYFASIDDGITIRQLPSGEVFAMAELPDGVSRYSVDSFAFTPDGSKLLGLFSPGNLIYVWETSTGKLLQILHWEGTFEEDTFAFSSDNQFVVIGSQNDRNQDSLVVWNLTTATLHNEVRLGKGHRDRVTSIDISPDGRLMAVATFDSVLIFDMAKFLE